MVRIGLIILILFNNSLFSQSIEKSIFAKSSEVQISITFKNGATSLSENAKSELCQMLSEKNISDPEIIGYGSNGKNSSSELNLVQERLGLIKNSFTACTGIKQVETKSTSKEAKHDHKHFQRIDILYRTVGQLTLKSIPSDTSKKSYVKQSEVLLTEPKVELTKLTEQEHFNYDLNSKDSIVFENVVFEPGSNEFLHNKTPLELYYLSEFMEENQSVNIQIAGHVCCIDDYKLSKSRAKTVYYFLRGQGISKERITYEGYSNKLPRVEEITASDERKNRRVEIIVTQR